VQTLAALVAHEDLLDLLGGDDGDDPASVFGFGPFQIGALTDGTTD
jgi:hypothetical protein